MDYRAFIELAGQFLPASEFKLESLSLFEPKNDLQTLSRYLNSVTWKLEIADYHVSEALEAIPRVLPKDEPDKRTAAWAMQFALMSGHEEGDAMAIAQRETEAHAIAAAQALHSVPDILAHALYLAFRLDTLRSMRECDRTVGSIVRALKNASILSVGAAVEELITSDIFKYLRVFVNTTKHRSLIDYRFHSSLEDLEDFGLSFSAFIYEDRSGVVEGWSSKTVKESLEQSFSFMSVSVDAIIATAESVLISCATLWETMMSGSSSRPVSPKMFKVDGPKGTPPHILSPGNLSIGC
jgi:hypothetical protein